MMSSIKKLNRFVYGLELFEQTAATKKCCENKAQNGSVWLFGQEKCFSQEETKRYNYRFRIQYHLCGFY